MHVFVTTACSSIIVCCCCRALLYSEKSRFSLGFRYLKADLTDKSHELFLGRFKWHNEKQDKIISNIKICPRFFTCFERYFLLIDSMRSKSNMIALKKTNDKLVLPVVQHDSFPEDEEDAYKE